MLPSKITLDENHLYGITHYKQIKINSIEFKRKSLNSDFSLTASLIATVASLEAKQTSAQSLFYATIIN